MKTKITSIILFALLFLWGGSFLSQAQQAKEIGNANFTYIDDFNENVDLWWAANTSGSGSTAGVIDDETIREHETEIVNPATGSTGSLKLTIQWNNDVEYIGTPSHLVRQHMPAGNANTPERRFQPGQALEVYLYGDGSGNRFRFMTRDGVPTLEGSQWISIDWTGWKRITWDYNKPENVVGWVNGDGEMNGANYYFDSFQITKDPEGTATSAVLYFDDLRIVDPFNVNFNIAGAAGQEVISIENTTYDAGQTQFSFFPGEYRYFVKRAGFVTATGLFEVDDQDMVVDVNLNSGTDPEYTVTFTVFDAEGELISGAAFNINDVVYDAGQYVFQLTPGFYNYKVSKDLYFDAEGTFAVIAGNVFVNVAMEEVPDVFDNVYLMWDVASTASIAGLRQETYSVWITEVSGAKSEKDLNPANYVKVFEETLRSDLPNWQYQPRKVELSQYREKNIRVAFRHSNSTGMDRLVIDNVKIEGISADEPEPGIVFLENFEGGVPTGFNPTNPTNPDDKWLPEGWEAIDYDLDGFNWFYAIRVEQDNTYKAHMRSQSYNSATQTALTPDNWLITPSIKMPIVLFHTVTFDVKDKDGIVLNNAVISINGVAGAAGNYNYLFHNGTYTYKVSLADYFDVEGTFTVEGESKTLEVTLNIIPLYEVTFNVNMIQSAGFEIGETPVYITGNFPGWDWAAPGTLSPQLMDPTENVFIFTRTIQLAGGTYAYKYFNGPSFDNGEWAGDPNRVLVVTGNMTVNDMFGFYVSVPELESANVKMFPNPARSFVNITAGSLIENVSIYNLAGQKVYSLDLQSESHTIQLEGLNKGIYMVRVLTREGLNTYKLQIVQ